MINTYNIKMTGKYNGVTFIFFNGMNTCSEYYNYDQSLKRNDFL